jgi:hypothetical protein
MYDGGKRKDRYGEGANDIVNEMQNNNELNVISVGLV